MQTSTPHYHRADQHLELSSLPTKAFNQMTEHVQEGHTPYLRVTPCGHHACPSSLPVDLYEAGMVQKTIKSAAPRMSQEPR